MTALSIESISKKFMIPRVRRRTIREHVFGVFGTRARDVHHVLRDVSFEVGDGETFGIMGRNGGGKSTLLKIIAGVYRPDAGVIRVTGDITAILELGIGWNAELDAVDNIYLLGTAMGLSIREVRSSLEEILAFAELERFANLKVGHYSSGMSARLAYAVALQAVREVLLLDEIFAVGDAAFRAKCEQRFRTLRAAGHTIVLVSHSPGIVADFCDRALLIEGGRPAQVGTGRAVADAYSALLSKPARP